MIVTDATVITCFAVRDDWSELADAVCEADAVWAAPLLWRSEVGSALMSYVQVAGMSLETALLAFHCAEEAVGGREYRVSSKNVLELAARTRCTVYDCEYVALAEELGVPLVTTDRQVLKAFPAVAVSLRKFVGK